MAEHVHTTRRALLKAAPALAIAPAAALANERESPLRALHHQWLEAELAYNRSSFDAGTPEAARLMSRFNGIQDEAMKVEPRTAEDFAFLVLFAGEDGYMAATSPPAQALVEMARRITGIEREV